MDGTTGERTGSVHRRRLLGESLKRASGFQDRQKRMTTVEMTGHLIELLKESSKVLFKVLSEARQVGF